MGHTAEPKQGKRGKKLKEEPKRLSKNQNIKLYKEKHAKIDLFNKEVAQLKELYDLVDFTKLEKFEQFPLTDRTKKGLKESEYISPTEIQKDTIGLALKGHDILGAAQTGSGKTLAFVIPLLERLYCSGWTILDGLGAVVITPTRELAYQIFEVLNKVGAYHQFSAALVIGGKDLAKEKKLLDKCNILICTPGRLLQHMDQNHLFNSMNLQILVLDEADRILDLGFAATMNAILENFPIERQTLLFSATQTKSVKDLVRLSLKSPIYLSVHEYSMHTTPKNLQQSYIVCEAHDKMNMIWSFIKSHKKQKILVFMASCKQAKYTFESLCRLRPGVSLMALYGSLHQLRRLQIYDDFCKKNHVVMFATDVASRGLDFPNVNWVVQLDCPEDINTYIHRAGRTARFEKGGESLLVLLPSEEKSMVEQLQQRNVPIDEIKVNPSKLMNIENKLETLVCRDEDLNQSCQRAFKAYLKSIFLMKDKTVFDVSKIDLTMYARSLGLKVAPRVRFLEKHLNNLKSKSVAVNKEKPADQLACSKNEESENEEDISDNDETNGTEDDEISSAENETSPEKPDREKITQLKTIVIIDDESGDEIFDNDSIIKSETFIEDIEGEIPDVTMEVKSSPKVLTKVALAKKLLKKNMQLNQIVKFDDDAKPVREINGKVVPAVTDDLVKPLIEEGYRINSIKHAYEEEIKIDKQFFSDRIKIRHRGAKLKLKEKRLLGKSENCTAVLNDPEEDSAEDGSESGEDIDPNNMAQSDDDSAQHEEGSMSNLESEDESIPLEHSANECSSSAESNPSDEECVQASKTGLKRKKTTQKRNSKKQRNLEDTEDSSKPGRSVMDDEALALFYLQNDS